MTVTIAALVYGISRHSSMLMDHATRVTPATGAGAADWRNFFWLSNHELLLPRVETATGRTKWQFYRLDTRTGSPQPFDKLNRSILNASDPPFNPGDTFYGQLSPDTRWIWWPIRTRRQPAHWRYRFAALDGSQTFLWESRAPREWADIVWNPDSTSWTATTLDRSGRSWSSERCTLNRPEERATVATRRPNDSGAQCIALPNGHYLILTRYPPFKDSSIPASDLNLETGQVVRRSYSPGSPPPLHLQAAAASPRGDRLALMMTFGSWPSPLDYLPYRMRPDFGPHVGLWTCRPDGSDMRLVGFNTTYDYRGFLYWTPDGKRLSFMDGGSVWTVPVETR